MNKSRTPNPIVAIRPAIPGDPDYFHEPKVRLMLLDQELQGLNNIHHELEISLMPLRNLREQICEEEWSDQVAGILGLYINHVDRVLERLQWELRHKQQQEA